MIPPESPSPIDASERVASAAMDALPAAAPIDPAFSRRVLAASRAELSGSASRLRRTERLFARVLVPVALVACALSWSYHVAHVAERVYLSHAGD